MAVTSAMVHRASQLASDVIGHQEPPTPHHGRTSEDHGSRIGSACGITKGAPYGRRPRHSLTESDCGVEGHAHCALVGTALKRASAEAGIKPGQSVYTGDR